MTTTFTVQEMMNLLWHLPPSGTYWDILGHIGTSWDFLEHLGTSDDDTVEVN